MTGKQQLLPGQMGKRDSANDRERRIGWSNLKKAFEQQRPRSQGTCRLRIVQDGYVHLAALEPVEQVARERAHEAQLNLWMSSAEGGYDLNRDDIGDGRRHADHDLSRQHRVHVHDAGSYLLHFGHDSAGMAENLPTDIRPHHTAAVSL